MTKLKLSTIPDNKPVKLTVELSAEVHRDLVDYTAMLGQEAEQNLDPVRLVAPMLARFMATDRAFQRTRYKEVL